MVDLALSNPSVDVNSKPVSIVPNSLTFKKGRGDVKVKSQTQGGEPVTIATVDAETRVGVVKFKLYNTRVNVELVNGWLGLTNGATIKIIEATTDIGFTGMLLTDDPEFSLGADGEVEVEFRGNPGSLPSTV